MARGFPLLWSVVLSLPFEYAGVRLLLDALRGDQPVELGLAFLAFGLFVLLVGLYVQTVSPEAPRLREGERLVDTRIPTQRVARARFAVSVPFFLATAYLYFLTIEPYIYPIVTLAVALVFFSTGLVTYWTNTLTTYYLTDRRVISDYRFVSLSRKELPLERIRGIEERQSPLETLARVGHVRVAAGGGGGTLQIVIRNVDRASEFANEIRELT
jgi:membrane protein YdbS with pleckstrin-like domain